MRAVMPGYINYFYKDGALPTHTKFAFNNLKIHTIHSIIIKNALTAMHKIKNFSDTIPQSVAATIRPDAPVQGSDHETCDEWLKTYGTETFRTSFFYKGPLIFTDSRTLQLQTPTALLSINAYKNNVSNFYYVP